jgi:YHS domain-containing protein
LRKFYKILIIFPDATADWTGPSTEQAIGDSHGGKSAPEDDEKGRSLPMKAGKRRFCGRRGEDTMDAEKHEQSKQGINPQAKMLDPVCGMAIFPGAQNLNAEYGGRAYSFCTEYCLASFQKDPERYANGGSAVLREVRRDKPILGRPFTCPVHRGVLQDSPGRCFQCGATLVRVAPFARESSRKSNPKPGRR